MAKKTVSVSDLSGDAIDEGTGAEISIRYADNRKPRYILDITSSEADEFAMQGRSQGKRGRKPKAEVVEPDEEFEPVEPSSVYAS